MGERKNKLYFYGGQLMSKTNQKIKPQNIQRRNKRMLVRNHHDQTDYYWSQQSYQNHINNTQPMTDKEKRNGK